MTTKTRNMTPKEFVPHVLVVLADMTEHQAGKAVLREDTLPLVCQRMNINVGDFGDSTHGREGNKTPWVHRQIDLAFRQMRDRGLGEYVKRGHWALTQEGLDRLEQSKKAPPPTASTLAAAKSQAAEDEESSLSNVVHLPAAGEEHPYSDDAYIRGLAVEQTACFGAHSVRSDVCKGCPLVDDCKAAVEMRKAEIAADLEQEERAAKSAAEAKKKKKEQQDISIDELMKKMGDGEEAGGGGTRGKYEAQPDQTVSSAFAHQESVCAQCGELIEENSRCFWVRGEGMFHPNCINVPEGT